MKPSTILPIVFCLLTGCVASVGTSGGITVPRDAKQRCESHCAAIGMGVGAVAIMADEVGCVCQGATETTASVSSAVTAGMATIAMERAERARQAQEHRVDHP